MTFLTRDQREVLTHELELQASGINDLDRCATAPERRRLRRTLATVLWLLDDLDETAQGASGTFAVTLPPDRFNEWLADRQEATRASLDDLAGDDVDDALDVHNTCRAIIAGQEETS